MNAIFTVFVCAVFKQFMDQYLFVIILLFNVIKSLVIPDQALKFQCYTAKIFHVDIDDITLCQNICNSDLNCVAIHYRSKLCSTYHAAPKSNTDDVVCFYNHDQDVSHSSSISMTEYVHSNTSFVPAFRKPKSETLNKKLDPNSLETNTTGEICVVQNVDGNQSCCYDTTTIDISCSAQHLIGTINPKIHLFSNLESVSLNANQLSGQIPTEITKLTTLTSLKLANNQLTNTIPNNIGNLKKLNHIYLQENQLTGTIPHNIGNLPKLEVLNLNINKLNGTIPPSIGFLEKLEILILSSNQLSGTIPNIIVNFTKLRNVDLSSNYLTGKINDTFEVLPKNIQELNLNSNLLTGKIPNFQNTDYLEHFRIFDLSFNKITGTIPNSFRSFRYLDEFNLSFNQLSGTLPNGWGNFPDLSILDVSSNQISGSISGLYSYYTNLAKLNFSNNNLISSIPSLCLSTSLITIDLSNNNFSGSIDDLFHSNICEYQYDLKYERPLFNLHLQSNNLSGVIRQDFFTHIPNVQNIRLDNNMFSGLVPTLHYLTHLEKLDISVNKFSGTIESNLIHLGLLKYINVSSNNLSGNIPPLPNRLNTLDFSNNKLIIHWSQFYNLRAEFHQLETAYLCNGNPFPRNVFQNKNTFDCIWPPDFTNIPINDASTCCSPNTFNHEIIITLAICFIILASIFLWLYTVINFYHHYLNKNYQNKKSKKFFFLLCFKEFAVLVFFLHFLYNLRRCRYHLWIYVALSVQMMKICFRFIATLINGYGIYINIIDSISFTCLFIAGFECGTINWILYGICWIFITLLTDYFLFFQLNVYTEYRRKNIIHSFRSYIFTINQLFKSVVALYFCVTSGTYSFYPLEYYDMFIIIIYVSFNILGLCKIKLFKREWYLPINILIFLYLSFLVYSYDGDKLIDSRCLLSLLITYFGFITSLIDYKFSVNSRDLVNADVKSLRTKYYFVGIFNWEYNNNLFQNLRIPKYEIENFTTLAEVVTGNSSKFLTTITNISGEDLVDWIDNDLIDTVEELMKEYDTNVSIIFLYTGHGVLEHGMKYTSMVGVDGKMCTSEVLVESELTDIHKVIILDCCRTINTIIPPVTSIDQKIMNNHLPSGIRGQKNNVFSFFTGYAFWVHSCRAQHSTEDGQDSTILTKLFFERVQQEIHNKGLYRVELTKLFYDICNEKDVSGEAGFTPYTPHYEVYLSGIIHEKIYQQLNDDVQTTYAQPKKTHTIINENIQLSDTNDYVLLSD